MPVKVRWKFCSAKQTQGARGDPARRSRRPRYSHGVDRAEPSLDPGQVRPQYVPATGDIIRVTLTHHGRQLVNMPAQSWIQHITTKKDMEHNWVFAGSRFFKFPDEPSRPPYYCANNGEIISIANFTDSMLDLPVMSSKEAAELGYVANKERIPPLKTKVIVTMEVLKKGSIIDFELNEPVSQSRGSFVERL
jgi:hypothetical protein